MTNISTADFWTSTVARQLMCEYSKPNEKFHTKMLLMIWL